MKPPTGTDLPPEIEVLHEPDRASYRLPPREFGRWRLLGLVPLAVGLVVLLKVGTFAQNVLFGENRPLQWTDFAFASIGGLIGLAIAYVPLGLGLAALWGRREIVVRGGKLRTTERAGPFWYTRRWPIARIERLSVIGLSGGTEAVSSPLLSKFDALAGNLRDGKRIMIAPAFPRALLGPLARDLAEVCNRFSRQQSSEPPEPIVVVLPDVHRSAPMRPRSVVDPAETEPIPQDSADGASRSRETPREAPPQPAGSRVEIERTTTGLTLTVPPAGLGQGSKGLFVFGVIWCGMCALFTTFVLLAEAKDGSKLGILAFLSLFWLVGLGLLLGAINMARRRAVLAVVEGELMVLQTSIFRTKSRQWRRGEVASVHVGPSGMEINEQPVLELQVVSADGDKFGLLAGRDVEELEWLAHETRQSLHLAEAGPAAAVEETMRHDVADQPAGSRIVIERFPQGFSLTIPPAGVWRGSHGFVQLGLFLLAVMTVVTGLEIYLGMNFIAHPFGTLFTLGGWTIAAAITAWGVQIGMRRAAVGVAGGRLLIVETSLFGSKQREYQPHEIAAVRAAPSGQSDDFEGLVELQIVTADGPRQSYLCGRDKHELFWIATLIRQALEVPADLAGEAEAADEAEPGEKSRQADRAEDEGADSDR